MPESTEADSFEPLDDGPSDEALRRRESAERARDDLYRLSGSFLTEWNNLCGYVALCVAQYFSPTWRSDNHREQFYTWLLGRLTDSNLLELVGQIADATGLAEECRLDLREAGRLLELRNLIAHSRLAPDERSWDGFDVLDLFYGPLHHQMRKRRGYVIVPASAQTLHAAIRSAKRLQFMMFGLAIAAAVTDGDPVQTFRDVAVQYPDTEDS